MMVGIPGSGKSTLAEWWLATRQVDVIVSSDAIRAELTGDAGDMSRNADVWPTFYARIEDALNRGLRVVADATHLTNTTWQPIIEIADKFDITPQAHVMRTPHRQSMERNSSRERVVPADVMYRFVCSYDEWVRPKVLAQHGFENFEYFPEGGEEDGNQEQHDAEELRSQP